MIVYSIGHSNRKIDEFLKILKKYNIRKIIDVRRFPSSKKFPWFNKDNLEKILRENNIKYVHFESLGGFRKEGYKNFAKTQKFKSEVEKLISILEDGSAIMCSEKYWFRCHRRFICKELEKRGLKVIHII